MEKETSEIAKLTERISKDPRSKLFVPLAEEYKKAGDVDMAIHVLSEGLKNNPKYVTARSLLGRLLMETGDLDAARKELEEVVKAIPDNLLAHRKLGDLYILQNKRDEALNHYKVALSLNPGDAEFASLISDVEAGADVRPRLQPQKSKPLHEVAAKPAPAVTQQQVKAPTASVKPAATSPSPASSAPIQPAQAESKPPSGPSTEQIGRPTDQPQQAAERTVTPPVAEAKSAVQEAVATAQRPEARLEEGSGASAAEKIKRLAAMQMETEEPEEVLVVEPLVEEHPSGDILSPDIDFFAEKAEAAIPDLVGEVQTEALTTAFETTLEAPWPAADKEEAAPGNDEKDAKGSVSETISEQSEPESEQAPAADDFTTDTLAELYISQGFFEKAISIYERMLADHPDSRGLKDKLDRVRAMASQPEEPLIDMEKAADIPKMPAGTDLFAEAKEYLPSEDVEQAAEENTVPAKEPAIQGEAREYVPPADTGKKDEEITIDAELFVEPEVLTPGGGTPEALFEADIFAEPKEYTPSRAEEAEKEPEAAAEKGAGGVFTAQPDQEAALQKTQYSAFEPREYIPPSALLREPGEEKVPVDANQPGAARKETIDRLEHWLKNIKKEK